MTVLAFMVAVPAVVLLIPALVFFIECVASVFQGSSGAASRPHGVSLAVLIPAHDEAMGIGDTIVGVLSQLGTQDRILVVADNCTDETARVARAAGAEVVERHAPEQRGKGFALAFGIDHLDDAPPDVLIVLDADCRLTPGSVDALVHHAYRAQRPIQSDNVSDPVEGSSLSMISSLAMLVRNRVRPRGLLRLGMPCHLMGTGMAFPWAVLRAAPHLEANLVEDLAMGAELALLGHEPLLCTTAGVRSALPSGSRAALAQRRRWEHGQLSTLVGYGPRLIRAGIAKRRVGLVVMGADLLVPPLALLVGLLTAVVALAGLLVLFGGSAIPLYVAGFAILLVATGVAIGWARYGREVIPLRYMLLIPLYVVWKLPLYAALLLGRREREWQRTER